MMAPEAYSLKLNRVPRMTVRAPIWDVQEDTVPTWLPMEEVVSSRD